MNVQQMTSNVKYVTDVLHFECQ